MGVTDLPPSSSHTCILVVVDRFSKACKLIPLKGLPTTFKTAELNTSFKTLDYSKTLYHCTLYRGPQFISRVWQAFFQLFCVSVSLSSQYHVQTNGQTECNIQEIGRYLQSYCHCHQHSWSCFLPWAEYAQNSLRQSTTGLAPFQCIFSFQLPLFPWSDEPSDVPAFNHWFQESERVWDSAHSSATGSLET